MRHVCSNDLHVDVSACLSLYIYIYIRCTRKLHAQRNTCTQTHLHCQMHIRGIQSEAHKCHYKVTFSCHAASQSLTGCRTYDNAACANASNKAAPI